MVVRDVPVLVVLDIPRRVGERVPDGRALAVFIPGALDLVRGRGDAPVKPVREAAVDRCGAVGCHGDTRDPVAAGSRARGGATSPSRGEENAFGGGAPQ